jgi:iron complex transport system substrate-binding protein
MTTPFAIWRCLLNALIGICVLAYLASASAVQITDDRGNVITLARAPLRIVSLLPSLTETVCALGQCARLVGVDRYSNYPASVTKLPIVGGGLDPNIEGIVALKPDLVLAATSSRSADRLRSLGMTVVALEPKTHADVRRVIHTLGQLLEVADADKVWRDIDAALNAASKSLRPNAVGLRVYFEVSQAPHAAGETSFIGETLVRLGARNIVPASMGPFPKLNPEFIVRADPDVIMVGDGTFIGMESRPGWPAMRAIKAHRVCVFSAEQGDKLVRPGPRMAEGARAMAQCLASNAP